MKPALLLLCCAFLLGPALTACEDEEGPAEKLGKQVDESVDQAGQELEKAADKIEEAADKLEERTE